MTTIPAGWWWVQGSPPWVKRNWIAFAQKFCWRNTVKQRTMYMCTHVRVYGITHSLSQQPPKSMKAFPFFLPMALLLIHLLWVILSPSSPSTCILSVTHFQDQWRLFLLRRRSFPYFIPFVFFDLCASHSYYRRWHDVLHLHQCIGCHCDLSCVDDSQAESSCSA